MTNMAAPTPENPKRGAPLTMSFSGDFRGRTQLTKVVRQAVVGLLVEAGCDREAQSAGMIVAQELAENLVKYSRTPHTAFTARVSWLGALHAEVVLETTNDANPDELACVRALLTEMASRADPNSLYQERIASSSTRRGSELGLLRIVVEGAMKLELTIEGARLHLCARSDAFNLIPMTSAAPNAPTPRNKSERIR